MTTVNDINKVGDNFHRNLGNGKLAGQYLRDMILSVVTSRDTTVLCRAMKRAESASDQKAAAVVRFCTKAVWPGAKMSKDKNGEYTIKISGVEADTEATERLTDAVQKGYSIRHSAFRKTVVPAVAVEKTDDQKLESVRKYIQKQVDDGVSLDAIIAAAQAMRS